jgi:hypothetical protein
MVRRQGLDCDEHGIRIFQDLGFDLFHSSQVVISGLCGSAELS